MDSTKISVRDRLRSGMIIPAHPLALTDAGALDEVSQRALTRYYIDSGAGGIAVGVHTTQFEIRDHGLLEPVLALAAESARDWTMPRRHDQPDETPDMPLLIAGACGETAQAVQEATLARDLGYDAILLSPGGLAAHNDAYLLDRAAAVSRVLPVIGFYLQPAVGGRVLPRAWWRAFFEIDNVVGVKAAPFNRYYTQDVAFALAESGRVQEIALYTGNDDHIVMDYLTTFACPVGRETINVSVAGGLLGHYACWTGPSKTVFEQAKSQQGTITELMQLAEQVTDMNAALFDVAHDFAGCIAGIQWVLKTYGIIRSDRCLNEDERLSTGQKEALRQVMHAYPHLCDETRILAERDRWRA